MNKILLIGCGHMGSALLTAWSSKTNNRFSVVDPVQYKKINQRFNKRIHAFKTLNQVRDFLLFDVIIFAVKPQIARSVLENFKSRKFKKSAIFISIIAGKKIDFFNQFLPLRNQFIRVMPNMPAIIDQGMTCMVSNRYVSHINKNKIELLFSKVGQTLWLKNEIQINKVTAISGSGPGYVFLFMDAFEKAAQQLGLEKRNTKKLVHQTVSGSVNLLLQERKSAEDLANNIAIKGGTTEAALNKLKKNNDFHNKLKKAVKAAFLRANELGK
jgi:pyrroline-5-carboxylate reductase